MSAGLVAGVLALLVLHNGLARILTRASSEQGLSVDPGYADALGRLAEQRAERGGASPDAVRAPALAALARDPLNAVALRALGLAQGNSSEARDRAEPFFEAAWRRTKRDTKTTLWLMSLAISQRDGPALADTVDAMLRRRGGLTEALTPTIIASAGADGRLPDPFLARLSGDAPWRDEFLLRYAVADVPPGEVERVFERAAAEGRPVQAVAVAALARRMIAAGQTRAAAAMWARRAPASVAPRSVNGSLPVSSTLANAPFEWTAYAPDSAAVAPAQLSDGSLGLRVVYGGSGPETPLATRLVAAAPGAHVFSGQVDTPAELLAPDGLVWRVYCEDGRQISPDGGPAVTGLAPSASFSLSFVVPPNGCEAQSIQLRSQSRDVLRPVQAVFWSLALASVPRPEAAP